MELGRKGLAAQHVWRILLHITPVRPGRRARTPSVDSRALPVGPGSAGRPPADRHRIARISSSRGPAVWRGPCACLPFLAGDAVAGPLPDSGLGTHLGARCRAPDSDRPSPRNHLDRCRQCLMALKIEFLGGLRLLRRGIHGRKSRVATCERNQLPSRLCLVAWRR